MPSHVGSPTRRLMYQRSESPASDVPLLGRDHMALDTDVFAPNWAGMAAYAFPHIALLPRVWLRVQVLLIAPHWPRQLWFPRLLELLVAEPVLLPVRKDLLLVTGARQRVPMRVIKTLRLTALGHFTLGIAMDLQFPTTQCCQVCFTSIIPLRSWSLSRTCLWCFNLLHVRISALSTRCPLRT
jgi:hypothetical protein